MDSRKIVEVIENLHPQPSVHLDSAYLPKVESLMIQILPALVGVYIPMVPKRLLNEASHEHWYRTREKRVGMPLDQLQREKGGPDAWLNAKPFLNQVTDLLKEDTSGPYFMGNTVSYADFVWAGFLIFAQRIGLDVFEELLSTVSDRQVHVKLLLALDEWSERNDR